MMNYCDKIQYRILSAECAGFEEMVDTLLSGLPADEKILRLVFIGMPQSNEIYDLRRKIICEKVKAYFGEHCPSLSYVAQPPLRGALLLEIHSYKSDAKDAVYYRSVDGMPYVIVDNEEGRFLFGGGFQADFLNESIEEQSEAVFHQIDSLLIKEGFPINSIVRQWNYIERITESKDDYQNYQAFNDARAAFYEKTTWPEGYPAATGIGTDWGGIVVDLDAVILKKENCSVLPIDNKLQVAAHAYSERVLAVSHKQKATPKFERAKLLSIEDKGLIYISGTAAIRGEESLKEVGLSRQLEITMENIAELIGNKGIVSMLRVYLKDKSFVQEAEQLMDAYKLSVPVSYMWADVCRDELLIEIEGIAKC